ncbi:MAG: MFS transporter [Candidatus Thiodiazotropha sp. (ex Ctena orbiculata)]|uniref:MFS transporter n=1 Tax=Candidatus Thiodiazotropha taylori TaxID=2792791 RepID=A0A944QTN2_9GAMM|nr:MFS transporter [Candidatus Thiodiazotropha taylori]PUB87253.1 MAG: MFS transporter [gamma proteobacterium symbiont of Ctena orbiculata]MBT2989267.1 MFS transporter [Candidatus Thiodiazotropha taylori]MBT2995524.1 MFS transporter [Candidatus Thiodiazotropha taylori]MBT2999522.1 MFS transporter [Candidatus Thiodiazotropha taylori]
MENSRLSAIRRPEFLLLLMAIAVPLSFAAWMTLLNNFAIERAAFSGREMGILQSLREIPGFLAFGVVFLLLLIREQRLAYLSLALLGLGTAVTGLFPSVAGLYITTVIMSVGFHYYETLQTSLALQWIDKSRSAETLGRLIAAGSFASILTFTLIWLFDDMLQLDYPLIYLIMGGLTLLIALIAWLGFPLFPQKTEQHKHMVFRKRYWLYYTLTFMSGARRQIFVVFAGFLMVEKFGYSVSQIAILFLINASINVFLAPRIGRLIGQIGERRALLIEYAGLILVFCGYALVQTAWVAAVLYIIDHLFFALAIALKTYFQKIAAAEDIASTAGVSFSINHIAAVVIPALFGIIWLSSPALVFLAGAAMAAISFILSLLVPKVPAIGRESRLVFSTPGNG